MKNLNLTHGTFYNVLFGKGAPNFTSNGAKPALKFNKSFPCYDVRFHGVANPDDYVMYEFQLPKQLGVWRAYSFQILEVFPVS